MPPPPLNPVSTLVDDLFLFDHVNEKKGGLGQPLSVNWQLVFSCRRRSLLRTYEKKSSWNHLICIQPQYLPIFPPDIHKILISSLSRQQNKVELMYVSHRKNN